MSAVFQIYITRSILRLLLTKFSCTYFLRVVPALPVLQYLHVVLFIKIWTISWISYTTLFKIRRYQIPF